MFLTYIVIRQFMVYFIWIETISILCCETTSYSPSATHEEINMGWDIQDNNDNVKVMVSGDYSRKDDNEPRTDFLIIDKISGKHKHISIDQYGNETEHHGYK